MHVRRCSRRHHVPHRSGGVDRDLLEEASLPYKAIPVDTSKGEQHSPSFRTINPNGKVPAIVDTEGPGARETRVFDSNAILIYLAEKTGKFLGAPEDRRELLSWLLFIASGLGPFSGQAVHFQFAAPGGLDYAVNRYRREAERHYQVLNEHLEGRSFIVGETYTIADISAWGWLDRASRVRKGADDPLGSFPNLNRLFEAVDSRPAVARAREVSKDHPFKRANDEETKRALFPSNYPRSRYLSLGEPVMTDTTEYAPPKVWTWARRDRALRRRRI